MNRAILVGVDGSPSSIAAADWAAGDAALHGRPLTLVNVLAPPVVTAFPAAPIPAGYTEWQQEQGRRHLRGALAVAEGHVGPAGPLRVDAETAVGPTVPTLVDLSESAALLVVGRRGHARLRRGLLGSVSSAVVRHAHCPVALVHHEHPERPRPAEAPVVVGIDGSPVSEAATALAFREASRRGVELVAVHAWRDADLFDFPGLDPAAMRADGELVLAERLAGWSERYPEVPVRRAVVGDRPAEALVEQSQSAQLVVVGSHGRGGFAGMVLGSVSLAVVQSAHSPVIVVRGAPAAS